MPRRSRPRSLSAKAACGARSSCLGRGHRALRRDRRRSRRLPELDGARLHAHCRAARRHGRDRAARALSLAAARADRAADPLHARRARERRDAGARARQAAHFARQSRLLGRSLGGDLRGESRGVRAQSRSQPARARDLVQASVGWRGNILFSETSSALAEPARRPAIPAAMADKQPYYITTAISYPNDAPHIGHAYEAVATDALARFRRLQGHDVFFLTGTDEHGIKMLQTRQGARHHPGRARRPQHAEVPRHGARARIARTTISSAPREERHTRACQELWRRMQAAGDIYLDKYAGWYSVRDEAYYDESELKEAPTARKLVAAGHAGRMGRGGELFLQALGLSGQAARLLRGASRVHRARDAGERGEELRARRPAGSLDLAHDLRLGHSRARAIRSTSCMCGSTR